MDCLQSFRWSVTSLFCPGLHVLGGNAPKTFTGSQKEQSSLHSCISEKLQSRKYIGGDIQEDRSGSILAYILITAIVKNKNK